MLDSSTRMVYSERHGHSVREPFPPLVSSAWWSQLLDESYRITTVNGNSLTVDYRSRQLPTASCHLETLRPLQVNCGCIGCIAAALALTESPDLSPESLGKTASATSLELATVTRQPSRPLEPDTSMLLY